VTKIKIVVKKVWQFSKINRTFGRALGETNIFLDKAHKKSWVRFDKEDKKSRAKNYSRKYKNCSLLDDLITDCDSLSIFYFSEILGKYKI
jgi:hypothetical protein